MIEKRGVVSGEGEVPAGVPTKQAADRPGCGPDVISRLTEQAAQGPPSAPPPSPPAKERRP